MVVCSADHGLQADVIFAIEGTAVNGAYFNDLKSNYIIPSLEYFSQGNLDEVNYMSENANCLYGIVTYHASDCLPNPSSDTIGPFSSPGKLLSAMDKLELIGGKGESHANIAEGIATALQCFEELQIKRDSTSNAQKHCILVCNSPPYMLPVMESQSFAGKTTEQLVTVLQERGINLSVISPRKIPSLYKLFEKAGGDLGTSQTKNYAKDLRHLVLLKGFSLKERPISPPGGSLSSTQNQLNNASIPITSLPSPLASSDSPIPGGPVPGNQNLLGTNTITPQAAIGQNPVYRPNNPQGINQLPQHAQAMTNAGMVNGAMVNTVRGAMMANQQFPNQQIQAPPGYHPSGGMGNRAPRWMMPPQPPQRPQYMPGGQQVNTTQGSALIAQLTQPPSSMPSPVNQFPQLGNNSPMGGQQAQQLRIGIMNNQQQPQNVQAAMVQNPGTPGMPQSSNPNQGTPPNQVIAPQSQNPNAANQQMNPGRQTIWNGLLEWIEKPKIPTDPQKVTKHVPCSVSANAKDGEPELKADGWPSKLIMQLMPKQLIGNIGGAYLKNSKSVLFHPTPCEALESLTKVMSTGFAGCVHFTSQNPTACDIKVLILLYTAEKRAYLGFIPNDQVAFVDRLRKVIQQQKSTQMMRQTTGPNINPQTGAPIGGPTQMPVSNTPTSQTPPQQGLMMSQTNTIALGGGQITQNVVTSSGQPGQGIGGQGLLGQNVPGGPMQQRLRMPNMQQTGNQLQNQPQQQQAANPNMQQGGNGNQGNMMGGQGGGQRPQPFANQLEVERQVNLDKINQLKQTLEAAQQQEQQYKNQLERISAMKTVQLQEALQQAQQQEMHYKILDQQQRMANQGNPQAANQQQRMMRPVMSNNPGLRTLLQQQPQYRQQMMGMHPMGGNQPRSQMGQQMQGGGNNQQQINFDDVSSFDFM